MGAGRLLGCRTIPTGRDCAGQRRSFTWAGDAVRAMRALAELPAPEGEVFNQGHTKDTSIGELARLVKQLGGSGSEIQFIPYEEAYEQGFEDMQRRLPDTSKAQAAIGYQPSLDLPEMLECIIENERSCLAQEIGA